jgi:hypothetical protein
VVDDDGKVLVFEVLVEEVAELGFGSNEMDADGEGVWQARIAPRISGSGALSEPTASSAMSMSVAIARSDYLAASLVSSTWRPL